MTQADFQTGYDIGWAGFTSAPDLINDAIRYFERRDARDGFIATHAFVVIAPDAIVEAHLETGVAEARLDKYFDPHFNLRFRRPAGWTPDLGARIAASAQQKVGDDYGTALIVAQLLAKTFSGVWLNKIFRGAPDRWVSRHLDAKRGFICSELVAWALAQQPELATRGVLQSPLNTIDPQELFDDDILFEPLTHAQN